MSEQFGQPKSIGSTGASIANFLNEANGNIFSLLPTAKFMTGARIVLRINNKIAAFAFGITWNIESDSREIETIDDYLPYEIVPGRIYVSGTLSGFRIPGQGPTNENMMGDVLSFMMQRYITIEARDSQTNELLFYTAKALVTGSSEEHRSEQLSTITLRWKAIGWVDEKSPKDLYQQASKPAATAVDALATSAKGQLNQLMSPGNAGAPATPPGVKIG